MQQITDQRRRQRDTAKGQRRKECHSNSTTRTDAVNAALQLVAKGQHSQQADKGKAYCQQPQIMLCGDCQRYLLHLLLPVAAYGHTQAVITLQHCKIIYV